MRYPTVPIVFAETRQLAQEWTYRFFGAAIEHRANDAAGSDRFNALPIGGPVPAREPTTAEVRAWAIAVGPGRERSRTPSAGNLGGSSSRNGVTPSTSSGECCESPEE